MSNNCGLDDSVVHLALANLSGQACWRQRVGRARSLSLGFGKKIPHGRDRMVDRFDAEWELGTYTATWRIVRAEKILCGSHEVVDSLAELNECVGRLKIGRIGAVSMISKFDIRVALDNDMHIDFLGAGSGDDEIFHVFCPDGQYLAYSITCGWKLMPQ